MLNFPIRDRTFLQSLGNFQEAGGIKNFNLFKNTLFFIIFSEKVKLF